MTKIGRTCKEHMIKELSDRLKGSPNIFVTDCTGLGVLELSKLRANLKGFRASYIIIKNSMGRLALKNVKQETLAPLLDGTTGLALGGPDPICTSKVLVKFSKDSGRLKIKGAMLDGAFVTEAQVKQISQMPSREGLLAMLFGGMKAPITGFVTALNQVIGKLAYAIEAIRKKKEKEG